MKKILTIFIALTFFTNLNTSFATEVLAPVVNLILEDDYSVGLTDRSNIQCSLTLDSISPDIGAFIPEDGTYTATYSYVISQRPLDVEVAVRASVKGNSSSFKPVGPFEGQAVVSFNEGSESISGQVQLSSINNGAGGELFLDTLDASCKLSTLWDEDDDANEPGVTDIGNLIIFGIGTGAIEDTVDWTFGT